MSRASEEFFDNYDWRQAWLAGWLSGGRDASPDPNMAEVDAIIASIEGSIEGGDNWVAIFHMEDGSYVYLSAWYDLDWTQWGGTMEVRNDLETLLAECLTDEDCHRLALPPMRAEAPTEPTILDVTGPHERDTIPDLIVDGPALFQREQDVAKRIAAYVKGRAHEDALPLEIAGEIEAGYWR